MAKPSTKVILRVLKNAGTRGGDTGRRASRWRAGKGAGPVVAGSHPLVAKSSSGLPPIDATRSLRAPAGYLPVAGPQRVAFFKLLIFFLLGTIVVIPLHASSRNRPDLRSASVAQAPPATLRDTVVVIDPGHGGDDPGAVGVKGIREKDVVLKIARRLKKELEARPRYRVYLTRTRDRTLTLAERNRFAARKKADLFISIHANASKDRRVHGIQTFYLNNATDEASRRLATRENVGLSKSQGDVKAILASLVQNVVTEESALLAGSIHRHLIRDLGKAYGNVRDLKVKTALFYVLVGAKVPGVLIESAFVTNPKEAARLGHPRYQGMIARAIARGVDTYFSRRSVELGDL